MPRIHYCCCSISDVSTVNNRLNIHRLIYFGVLYLVLPHFWQNLSHNQPYQPPILHKHLRKSHGDGVNLVAGNRLPVAPQVQPAQVNLLGKGVGSHPVALAGKQIHDGFLYLHLRNFFWINAPSPDAQAFSLAPSIIVTSLGSPRTKRPMPSMALISPSQNQVRFT